MFLLNQQFYHYLLNSLQNLQYKMFLLNLVDVASDSDYEENLQYKMFLLNLSWSILRIIFKIFTIQNVPIKSTVMLELD